MATSNIAMATSNIAFRELEACKLHLYNRWYQL